MDIGATLAIDNDYLFCTSRTIGDFDFIINPTQFAHSLDSQNAKAIIASEMQEEKQNSQ